MVAAYVAAHGQSHRVATLTRWLASISKAHQVAGQPNPTRSALVKMTMRGIKRVEGTAQLQAKPLLPEDLALILSGLGKSLKDDRDRALLAWAGRATSEGDMESRNRRPSIESTVRRPR
jgi:hypothetical protein